LLRSSFRFQVSGFKFKVGVAVAVSLVLLKGILPIIFYHYTEPLFEGKGGLGSLVLIGLTNHHGLLLKSPWSFARITMVFWWNHHGDLEDAKGWVD